MSNKRKREGKAFDPNKKQQEGTVRWFSVRWSRPKDIDVATFKTLRPALEAQLAEWSEGSKSGYCFQLEKTIVDDGDGKSHENWHYQGDMQKAQKARAGYLAAMANKTFLGIHISPSSDAGISSLRKYSSKSKTREDGPWTNNKELDAVINPKYDDSNVLKREQLYPWQATIADALLPKPDDRTVNVVVEHKGNTGKSALCMYLETTTELLSLGHGDAKALTHLISENMHKKAYIFDLTRQKPSDFAGGDIYAVMEGLKNGRLINLKYMSKVIRQFPAHVWVFTNCLPNMSSLSKDRWKIWGIDHQQRLCPFDYKAYHADQRQHRVIAGFEKLKNVDLKAAEAKDSADMHAVWKKSTEGMLALGIKPPSTAPAEKPEPADEPDISWIENAREKVAQYKAAAQQAPAMEEIF